MYIRMGPCSINKNFYSSNQHSRVRENEVAHVLEGPRVRNDALHRK